MTEAENKHIIMARMQLALAKHGVHSFLNTHFDNPDLSCFTYALNGGYKSIYSTAYTEEQLLDIWSKIESEGVDALSELGVSK